MGRLALTEIRHTKQELCLQRPVGAHVAQGNRIRLLSIRERATQGLRLPKAIVSVGILRALADGHAIGSHRARKVARDHGLVTLAKLLPEGAHACNAIWIAPLRGGGGALNC